jgi:hypothetical protein
MATASARQYPRQRYSVVLEDYLYNLCLLDLKLDVSELLQPVAGKNSRQGLQACVRMSTSDPSQKGINYVLLTTPHPKYQNRVKQKSTKYGMVIYQNRPELVVGYISDWCSFQVSYFRPPSFLLLPLCACKVRPAARRL